jgi:alpha-L-rhamnosidase
MTVSIDAAGAQWLAAEDAAERTEREAGWFWAWGEAPTDERPRQFVWRFVLAAPLTAASLLVAAQKGLTGVWLDGRALHASDDMLGGRELQCLSLGDLAAGEHRLAVDVRLFHPFIKQPIEGGLAARLSHAGGHLVPAAHDWLTRLDAPAGWHEAHAVLDGFAPARVPACALEWQPTAPRPARLLRQAFTLPSQPAKATLTITALGGYEAELNGQRVGDALLTPENSDFRRRLLVQRFDVATQLNAGDNALGVMVGDGFYASEAIGRGRYPFGEAPRRLWARLEMTLADGTTQTVITDEHWRAASAPVRFSEIYHGETHDARLEQPGWSSPGFDDSRWDAVWCAPTPPCELHLQESPPIRATLTLPARRIDPLPNGDHVIDFGQNFAGWCRIRVRGEAGRTVTLRFAELLGDDGAVDMRNLRAARCTDRYTLRGAPEGETWQPRFTYHGFRYVQVSGWPGDLRAEDIEGIVVHSDLAIAGHFESTQPILQGLWRNTLWSQRSNFVGLPTDCPQRDERLGWTGDAQIFWPTAAFNMDVRGFTRRFLADLRASQQPGGAYMDTNPPALPAAGAPGWSDAGVVLPHTVWQHYGDTAIIEEHWDSMERWMAWIADANPDGLWRQRRDVDFGDWLSLDAVNLMDETTPKLLTATACWARMLGLMAEMAQATGRVADAAHYARGRTRVEQAFQAAFVKPDGHVGNHSHTGYILALAFGLVPDACRQAAADHLAANIRQRGTLLTTGFLGTPFSLDVLADHGHAGLAVELLLRTEFPSWGYMVDRGATTIWERWNGDTGDLAMNSFNHYALGAITAFLYRRVAGIASAGTGFARVACRPLMDSRLGEGRSHHDTGRGRVSSVWGVDVAGRCWFEIDLPPGVEAAVEAPGRSVVTVCGGHHRFVRAF